MKMKQLSIVFLSIAAIVGLFIGYVVRAQYAPANMTTVTPQSTDPGCTVTKDIGKLWMDDSLAATTHFKACGAVASVPTWVTLF